MKNGILLNVVSSDNRLSYNAADKARMDVERTLVRNGYEIVNIPYAKYLGKGKAILKHLWEIKKALSLIKKKNPNDIIIQYPGFHLGIRAINLLTKLLKKRHITILIHDIDSLRNSGVISEKELSILRRSSRIIVHTENMYNYLKTKDISGQMNVLWLFDYYAKGELTINKPSEKYSIVFAGNLKKSNFLKKVDNNLSPYTLHLYGLPIEYNWPKWIEYEGKFAPDEISDIKGDWGLVWDGDTIDSCAGRIGDYLKFNSSHKVSLYIASGKPVIVWNKSAIAPFIKKNHLGLCIDSIKEIPHLLNKINIKDYTSYTESVRNIQRKLRNGEMLEQCI